MTMNRPQQILVVDDEPMVREVVTAYLERDGFEVHAEADGTKALEYLATASPDLVVLDVMLPHVDGLQILANLRAVSDVPVILLTARTEEPDRVLGLELGADDYVTKPFSPRELAARVRSVLRRSAPASTPQRLEFEDLVIDEESRDVIVRGEVVDLTPKEFELLAHLAASPKKVFTRGDLLEDVWASSPDYQDPSTVTVHIRRLRRKIEIDPESPRWLTTVWGVGYR
ncbi:MAG TPA: response regulator transcription factor, partial [Actinobacteria bacterium]|nr:response regulator transcription factor [Actinomycetota bacterium]